MSLSDEQSVKLFTTIDTAGIDSLELQTRVPLTRKQYSRLSRMTRAGMIKRRGGKLVLTAFGKIVHESQKIVESVDSHHVFNCNTNFSFLIMGIEDRELVTSIKFVCS